MKHSLPARAMPWLRLVVGIGIIVGLIAVLGGNAFAKGLAVIGPLSILAAIGIGFLTTLFSALRWTLVARKVGLQLPVKVAIAEVYRATFLNAVLPSGVLGDVDRAVRHGRDSGDMARGARAVVLERTAGQIVLIVVACIVLPTQPALVAAVLSGPGHPPVAVAIGAAAILIATTGVAIVIARHRPGAARWRRILRDAVADARHGLLARDTWPALFGLSLLALASLLLMFFVAAYAAGAGAKGDVVTLLPLLLMALLAMALPVNIGGWGPREGIAALGFWMAGLGAPLGITSSVAYGVLAMIASLPGGIVLLVRRAKRDQAAKTGAPIDAQLADPAPSTRPAAEHPAAPARPAHLDGPITAPIPVIPPAPAPRQPQGTPQQLPR